jgi:uncharacterized protein
MIRESLPLPPLGSGLVPELNVFRFGRPGALPKIYVQGGLHADEAPGTLVAYRLVERLATLAADSIRGEIVIVPVANPIGLQQRVLGTLVGRFSLEDGRNFNRGYPDITAALLSRLEGLVGPDRAENTRQLRSSLQECVAHEPPASAGAAMKSKLIGLSIDADVVLDLHCDTEALLHAYTHPALVEPLMPLFRLLGTEIVLTGENSGDNPFDEAVSVPWQAARSRFGAERFELGGIATTIELRGQCDTEPDVTDRHATAILQFLTYRGVLAGSVPLITGAVPQCTPVAGCDLLPSPAAGALAWHCTLGADIHEGQIVAEVVDVQRQRRVPVRAATAGRLFARTNLRQVVADTKLGKIAGSRPLRAGILLGP